jgi:hypothetical protein
MLRFHTPAHRTVRADFSHTALRLASPASTRWFLFRIGRDSDNIAIFAGKYSSFRDRLVVIGVDRQSQSPDCWSLPETRQKSGSFPPPALPGFFSVGSEGARRSAGPRPPLKPDVQFSRIRLSLKTCNEAQVKELIR